MIGALAGLINDYPPDRGNFDRWVDDPHHGRALNLAQLDLIQRRNHILLAALDALAPPSQQLLQTLALLQSGADFEALQAFNPHLPPQPNEVSEPEDPTRDAIWSLYDEEQRVELLKRHEGRLAQRKAYLEELAAWKRDRKVQAAPGKLAETLRDLEKRGLLQYEPSDKRYDLHPVVRGVAAGRMAADETAKLGQMVVDYFTSQPHDPWEQAGCLEDVEPSLDVVRVLIRMGQYERATEAYMDLSTALLFNLGANAEVQALLKPFFPDGWDHEPVHFDDNNELKFLTDAAICLADDHPEQSQKIDERVIGLGITRSMVFDVMIGLHNLADLAFRTDKMAESERLLSLELKIAELKEAYDRVFVAKSDVFALLAERCDIEADRLWQELDSTPRPLDRETYRPGHLEQYRVNDLFYRNRITEDFLTAAEDLAGKGRNHEAVQQLHRLRGQWCLTRNEPGLAAQSFAEALRMSREAGYQAAAYEALLALARLGVGAVFDAQGEAERLGDLVGKLTIDRLIGELALAELWKALGEPDRAIQHGLYAHHCAVADGEPYVHRYYLNRTRALLTELGAPLPEVPRFDPAASPPYPWEEDVRAFIDKLRVEQRAQRASRKPGQTRSKRKQKAG